MLFFEEFPWLSYHVNLCSKYDYVFYVSRVDLDFLDYRPIRVNTASAPFCKNWEYENLKFLDWEGYTLEDFRYPDALTVAKYIKRHFGSKHVKEEISFVLSRLLDTVIIYKPPKDLSIPAWIEMLAAREKEFLRKEIDAIDNELEHPLKPKFPPNRTFHEGWLGITEEKEDAE